MIYKVTGQIIDKYDFRVVLQCQSGLAYEILTTATAYTSIGSIGDSASLFTHFVFKENDIALYGFLTIEEKKYFLLLNTVSKIGPKTALGILSSISIDMLVAAIVSKDIAALSKLPGIGKKTAERMVLELKDKVAVHVFPVSSSVTSTMLDVLSALTNLGYKQSDCELILNSFDPSEDFNTLFKKALAKLAGRYE